MAFKTFEQSQMAAYHFKPYFERRIPAGIENLAAYEEYYERAMIILHRLYKAIASKYVSPAHQTDLTGDDRSVLTCRRYLNEDDSGVTGIPMHSDHHLLTLNFADSDGLEVQTSNGEWVYASSAPFPRFYVNVGDWMLFQIGSDHKFIAGVHRVEKIPPTRPDRYSLSVFLNPAWDEKQSTPSGIETTYQDYLFCTHYPNKAAFFEKK